MNKCTHIRIYSFNAASETKKERISHYTLIRSWRNVEAVNINQFTCFHVFTCILLASQCSAMKCLI